MGLRAAEPMIQSHVSKSMEANYGCTPSPPMSADRELTDADRYLVCNTFITAPEDFSGILHVRNGSGQRHQIVFGRPADGTLSPAFLKGRSASYNISICKGDVTHPAYLLLPNGARYSLTNEGLERQVFDQNRFGLCLQSLSDACVLASRLKTANPQFPHGMANPIFCESEFVGVTIDHYDDRFRVAAILHSSLEFALDNALLTSIFETYSWGVVGNYSEVPCLLELGPDSYTISKGQVVKTYTDVSVRLYSCDDILQFGFLVGGYGAAVNWILAKNHYLSEPDVRRVWRGLDLTEQQERRRQAFTATIRQWCNSPMVTNSSLLRAELEHWHDISRF